MKKSAMVFIIYLIVLSLASYERDQASRYANRYTRLTEDYTSGYSPDSLWWNVNPFIYELEGGDDNPNAGYINGSDCAHFVSQSIQAGGIKMFEDNHNDYIGSPYLGITNCKNLHTLADSLFPVREDWYHTTFQDSFWMEEILNPFLETSHYPYYSSYNSLDLCSDIYFLKIYLSFVQYSYEDNFSITTPHGTYSPYYYLTNSWTPTLLNYYNSHYYPIVFASFNFNDYYSYGNNLYGYRANGIKWKAYNEPHSDYHEGDFQIFCNYRSDNVNFVDAHEIFYENTYNDIGRTIRYRHAAICVSGSGNSAHVSAHNVDHNNEEWNYAYCSNNDVYDSLARNTITFYQVNDASGELPNLEKYNKWDGEALITTTHPDSTNDINYFSIGDTIYTKFAFQNTGNIMIPDRFRVNVENSLVRTIIDTLNFDGILANDSIFFDVKSTFVMPDVDSVTITVTLDAGTNADYETDWERTWNNQNWHETNESDNEFSKTIYKGLPKPTDVEINVSPNRGTINIQWSGDSDLIYKIYSSTNPYDGFEEDLTGAYNGNSWSAPQPTGNRFYYVIATDGRNSTKSKSIPYLRRKRK